MLNYVRSQGRWGTRASFTATTFKCCNCLLCHWKLGKCRISLTYPLHNGQDLQDSLGCSVSGNVLGMTNPFLLINTSFIAMQNSASERALSRSVSANLLHEQVYGTDMSILPIQYTLHPTPHPNNIQEILFLPYGRELLVG